MNIVLFYAAFPHDKQNRTHCMTLSCIVCCVALMCVTEMWFAGAARTVASKKLQQDCGGSGWRLAGKGCIFATAPHLVSIQTRIKKTMKCWRPWNSKHLKPSLGLCKLAECLRTWWHHGLLPPCAFRSNSHVGLGRVRQYWHITELCLCLRLSWVY